MGKRGPQRGTGGRPRMDCGDPRCTGMHGSQFKRQDRCVTAHKFVRERGWRQYGVQNFTVEDFDRIFAEQDGLCAICSRESYAGKRLNVDHDHETGQARALLCRSCNQLVGLIEGPRGHLALEYLERFKHD